ncbi:MAG: prenyltransferase [Gammaproteobacteria bacterium]|nr:prenyltransferase [Gammaproteobacteria bacterium]
MLALPSAFANLLPWLTAARPVGHGMIAIPLLLGQGLALSVAGHFSWQWFVFAQLFGVFIQVHTLYLNDYADEQLDRQNHNYWLSGGSRVIPDGKLTGTQLYRASFIPAIAALGLACVAALDGRPLLLLFVVLGLFASWSYSLPPVKSSYRGFGELHQGLSCGVGLPLCAFYLQTGSLAAFPWLFLLPVFLIFFASNIVTALPDIDSDELGGKRTYPVRYGVIKAKRQAVLLSAFASALVLFFVLEATAAFATALLIAGPPSLLFIGARFSGLTEDTTEHKRFMLTIMIGQLWLLLLWVAQLFL